MKIRSDNPIFNSFINETKEGQRIIKTIPSYLKPSDFLILFEAEQKYEYERCKNKLIYGKDTP